MTAPLSGRGNARAARDIDEARKALQQTRKEQLTRKDGASAEQDLMDAVVKQAYRELAEEDEARRLAGETGPRKTLAFYGGRRQRKLRQAERIEQISVAFKGRGRSKDNAFHLHGDDLGDNNDKYDSSSDDDYDDFDGEYERYR